MIELNSIIQRPNIPQIKVFNKYFGELVTVNKSYHGNHNKIRTELQNKLGKVLGHESFLIENNNQEATGLLIIVNPEYRKKSFHFGEILRLSSIMMILENKIEKFKICSKDTAIYFHSKYKFKPAIKNFEERDKALISIIKNCKNKHSEIKNEAEEILKDTKTNCNAENQRELCVKTNVLLNKYLQLVMNKKDDYLSHPINTTIDMVLTKDSILENKDFFNNLFQKHNIDYKI